MYFAIRGADIAQNGRIRGVPLAGLALATCALLLAACGDGGPAGDVPDDRPSVILISVDTLNPASLRPYNADAPALENLDAFAAEAARFRRAVSPSSWTLPAHASMLTGVYPDRHGATDPRRRIAAEVRTLAELFRDEGYETVGFSDAGYVDAEFGFGRGFAVYNDASDLRRVKASRLPRKGRPNEKRGETLFDRALAYLKTRRPSSPPVFLFLQTYSVHDYFKVHSWAAAGDGPPGESASLYRKCIQGADDCPEEVWARMQALYRAEIAHLDAGLGRLLEALDAQGLRSRSYIALLSDHGEGFDPGRNRIHHGGRLHRDVLQVPFLLSGPDVPAADVETAVSLVDVAPTLLELVGLAVPDGLDGRALGPHVRGAATPITLPPTPVYAMEHYYHWENGRRVATPETQTDPLRAAVVGGNDWFIAGGEDEPELYDWDSDPEQASNLAGSASRTEVLRSMIEERLRALPQTADAPVDSALQEQLRSLGYVE